MDPAAIRDLQRLYAQKHANTSETSRKRRKIAVQEDSDDQESCGSTPSEPEDKSSQTDHLTDLADDDAGSFAGFDDEHLSLGTSQNQHETVQVVVFDGQIANPAQEGAAQGYKSFMSGKVPKITPTNRSVKKRTDADDESESDTTENLKKDVELQKLLRESHLLHAQADDSLETKGKIRQKAIQAQLISNGASKPKQQRMPIGMRKGIEAAAKKREAASEKYSRDNGIVTAHKSAPITKKRSNKTLHELNLGKYKNGKLTITRKEIDRINGPKGSAKGKKRRGFRDFSNIG